MMKIITVDSKEWTIKYRQNAESISFEVGTKASSFPDFIGSKLNQNSSSSDKYSLNFSIHISQVTAFKESLKKFVTDETKAVKHPVYGALTHIIVEHDLFGAIKGSIISAPSFNTSSKADVNVSFTFQIHTEENPLPQRDLEIENTDSLDAIDTETQLNFDVELSAPDKNAIGRFADNLAGLYSNIQNSQVVSAFNDLNSELNKTLLDSKRIMSSVKNIISLPNTIFVETRNKLDLFQAQAEAIKNVPVDSFNMALFNINTFSFNVGSMSRTAYVSESALEAAGIQTVPLV